MAELKSTKRKTARLLGPLSDSGGITSVITETETPGEVLVESSFAMFDCGCAFEPGKIFKDPFTGHVICRDCTVTCKACGIRFWVIKASRVPGSEDCYCPEHRWIAWLRTLGRTLLKGL